MLDEITTRGSATRQLDQSAHRGRSLKIVPIDLDRPAHVLVDVLTPAECSKDRFRSQFR